MSAMMMVTRLGAIAVGIKRPPEAKDYENGETFLVGKKFIIGPKTEPELSPGASKPATHGRFKTSHDFGGVLVHNLTVTGSTFCSKYQTSTGFPCRLPSQNS
jgi:hypothetical protein